MCVSCRCIMTRMCECEAWKDPFKSLKMYIFRLCLYDIRIFVLLTWQRPQAMITYVCSCVCVCVYIYIYIYTHTARGIYMRLCIYRREVHMYAYKSQRGWFLVYIQLETHLCYIFINVCPCDASLLEGNTHCEQHAPGVHPILLLRKNNKTRLKKQVQGIFFGVPWCMRQSCHASRRGMHRKRWAHHLCSLWPRL
jgi:hypothetical protein